MSREITTTALAWVYNALTTAWTVVLLAGMAFLYRHRKLPFLRIRRLPLVFSAVVLLHLYGVASMIAYTIGNLIPCAVQYWVMSIYLPFGMALLQAANSQFLHIASQQRRFARVSSLDSGDLPEKPGSVDPSLSWFRRIVETFRRLDRINKVLIYIGVAMLVEVRGDLYVPVSPSLIDENSWCLRSYSILAPTYSTRATASSTPRCPELMTGRCCV